MFGSFTTVVITQRLKERMNQKAESTVTPEGNGPPGGGVHARRLHREQIELVHRHVDHARNGFTFVWSEYMRWYTFFLGFNVAGLGIAAQFGSAEHRQPMAIAFVVFLALSLVFTTMLLVYTARLARRQLRLNRVLLNDAGDFPDGESVRLLSEPVLPFDLAMAMCVLAVVVFLVLLRLWYAVAPEAFQLGG
jgi:hypothetical protein